MNEELLTQEELEKVSAGTGVEWWAFAQKMRDKYGKNFRLQMTPEENDLYKKWLHHMPGEPDPE